MCVLKEDMSSSRAEQGVPRSRTSEAGESRGQGPLPSVLRSGTSHSGRPMVGKEFLRKAVTKKR